MASARALGCCFGVSTLFERALFGKNVDDVISSRLSSSWLQGSLLLGCAHDCIQMWCCCLVWTKQSHPTRFGMQPRRWVRTSNLIYAKTLRHCKFEGLEVNLARRRTWRTKLDLQKVALLSLSKSWCEKSWHPTSMRRIHESLCSSVVKTREPESGGTEEAVTQGTGALTPTLNSTFATYQWNSLQTTEDWLPVFPYCIS